MHAKKGPPPIRVNRSQVRRAGDAFPKSTYDSIGISLKLKSLSTSCLFFDGTFRNDHGRLEETELTSYFSTRLDFDTVKPTLSKLEQKGIATIYLRHSIGLTTRVKIL